MSNGQGALALEVSFRIGRDPTNGQSCVLIQIDGLPESVPMHSVVNAVLAALGGELGSSVVELRHIREH